MQHSLHKYRLPVMQDGPLTARIVADLDAMPAQLQAAARFVVEHPRDVAMLSMREQARRAGVQPWTMTRFAQRLGLAGYDDIKALYVDALREGDLGFAAKAAPQVASQRERGDRALARDIVQSTLADIARLAEDETLGRLADSAALLAGAERVYCLGLRSCHPVAAQFAYVMSFLGDRTILLDAAAGTGLDALRGATPQDALLAVSVAPYTRLTVEAATYADARGVPIVAVTDGAASPLAARARHAVLVPTDGPSFFHSVAPAFVVGEILAALVAGRGGRRSLDAIRRSEEQLKSFGVHWAPGSRSPSAT